MPQLTATTIFAEHPAHASRLDQGPSPRTLELLGHDAHGQGLYFLERSIERSLPELYVMPVHGRLAGRMLPVRSVYDADPAQLASYVRRRIAALRERLISLRPASTHRWRLLTHVHACTNLPNLRDEPASAPVRALDLELVLLPAMSQVDMGARAAVRAYERPYARLTDVRISITGAFGVGMVSYVGSPGDHRAETQVPILIRSRRGRSED